MDDYINCFSCGAKSLNFEGECHEYMLASPGCYEMFNEVLAREYSDLAYARAHHYTVDAYAVHHPGKADNPKAVRSTGIHLVSLYFLFEKQMKLTQAAELKTAFAAYNKTLELVIPLQKPERFNEVTVFDVWDNERPGKHFEICEHWARSAWNTWAEEHARIVKWSEQFVEATCFEVRR